jgi:hypothetical protein
MKLNDERYQEYEAEMERTEQLFELFEELESENFQFNQENKMNYEKMNHFLGVIIEVKETYARLRCDMPQKTKTIQINSKISQLLKVDDVLSLILGKRSKKWHIFFVTMVGNSSGNTFAEVTEGEDGSPPHIRYTRS